MDYLVLVANRMIETPVSRAEEEPSFPISTGNMDRTIPSDQTSTLERVREQAEGFAHRVDSLLSRDASTQNPERLAELAEGFARQVGVRMGVAPAVVRRLVTV